MFCINLLPPKEKQNLAYELRKRAVLAVSAAILGLELVTLVFLMPAMLTILLQKTEVMRALSIETDNSQKSGVASQIAKFQILNKNARRLIAEDGNRAAYGIFARIIDMTPPGVALDGISLDLQSRTAAISGFAPTRDLFLAFSSSLKADPAIVEVSSPVSNVIRGTNIKFFISATLQQP